MAKKRKTGAKSKGMFGKDKPDDNDAQGPAVPGAIDKKGVDDVDFQSMVATLAQDADSYITEEVAYQRSMATDYYKGRLPDIDKEDDEDDRSRAVLTEVRDTVLGMMPDLLRIYFSTESLVEYKPVPEENPELFQKREAEARQATDYVRNVTLKVDNPNFFTTMYSVFQDALVRKTGVLTWYWEKSKKPLYSEHTGLTEQEALILASDPDVTVTGKRMYPDKNSVMGSAMLYDLKIKRVSERGKARIQGIPVEAVIVNRGATSVGDATLFGYWEEKKIGDLVALGYDATDLKDCDLDPTDTENIETQARQPLRGSLAKTVEPSVDSSQRLIRYSKLYVLADRDGDGIPELNRVITAGTKYKILESEPVDEAPFATFCPYPEGYTFFGESVADLTMDVQRIKSRIMRDTLDSLAQSVLPQTSVLENAVNMDDVLNPDTSRVIRTRQIGAVQPHIIPFVGKDALPVLDLMTSIREARTGMSDASQGLDPKTLQSTDKDAVNATLSKAQGRIEMVARIFAETGWKQLFSGLLRLIVKNQDQSRTVELNGTWVPVNPKDWNENMHVDVTLPLGRGPVQEQITFLTAVAQKQEELLQTLGFDNPLVDIAQYRYTLAKICELASWRNTESFFKDPAKMDPTKLEQWKQQAAQAKAQASQAQGPVGPNPEVEMAKVASHEKIALMKLQHDAEMKSLELQANFQLEAMRLYAEQDKSLSVEKLRAEAKQASAHIDAATAIVVQRMKENGSTERATIPKKEKASASN